ncbi:Predicted protein (modular protein) [Listeria monocytogenes]|nr:Predicted protein (modular protein) [Listeria monocytogenes]
MMTTRRSYHFINIKQQCCNVRILPACRNMLLVRLIVISLFGWRNNSPVWKKPAILKIAGFLIYKLLNSIFASKRLSYLLTTPIR